MCKILPCHLEYLHFSRYLYYQSFNIDACFRFKHRQISSYEKDPELGPGFAYVVAWESYQGYLEEHANQSEVSGFLFASSSHLTTPCRLARVLGYLLLSTQIQSFPRVILLQVSCAQRAATNSFSQKGPANFKRVKGLF